ncbi:MAG: histidine phosphatase family protein [Gemmataceae bacterium]
MPTRVLLLRHAETADPSIFHGAESDVGLSGWGYQQAQITALHLATYRPQVLISSAMTRARETAQPIATQCGLPVQVEPSLHERRVGLLSGTPTGGKDGPWPETLRRWMAGETNYATPGAESYDDIRERVVPIWERVTTTHTGRTIVIVAHGIVCRVLLLSLLPGHTPADWPRLGPIRNVAIHELVRESEANPWQALRINALPPGLEGGG